MNGIKLEIMAAPFQNIYLYIVHPLQHLNIISTQHFLVSHYIIYIHQMFFLALMSQFLWKRMQSREVVAAGSHQAAQGILGSSSIRGDWSLAGG